jgi:hypothetical protein
LLNGLRKRRLRETTAIPPQDARYSPNLNLQGRCPPEDGNCRLCPVAEHFLRPPTSAIIRNKRQFSGKQEGRAMLEAKDFATGCLTLILCVILIPFFFLVFKLTLIFAVFLAILTGVILGITLVGRIVRLFITGK